jgi:hypothetical protein
MLNLMSLVYINYRSEFNLSVANMEKGMYDMNLEGWVGKGLSSITGPENMTPQGKVDQIKSVMWQLKTAQSIRAVSFSSFPLHIGQPFYSNSGRKENENRGDPRKCDFMKWKSAGNSKCDFFFGRKSNFKYPEKAY